MNDHLLNRYSAFLSAKGEKFFVVNGSIYRPYSKMITTLGSIEEDYSISPHQARELITRLGGILVRWTNGNISTEQIKQWYAVICTDFIPIEELKSKQRNEINRGLTNCEVKRIDPVYLSKEGYKIYYKVLLSYKNLSTLISTKKEFSNEILSAQKFDDIIHYWGVFYKNNLIAYSKNYVYDRLEASYSSIKLNPDYLSLYPSYALIYEMNKFYLLDNGFKYVNDGFRSILHETNIQNYLIKKFNFKKIYLDLNIYYKPIIGTIIKSVYPFRKVFGNLDKRFNALLELEKIRRSSNEKAIRL